MARTGHSPSWGKGAASGAKRGAGFTLLEIMLVVSVIGLLAVLAIPAFVKSRMRAQDTAFLNDLRVFSGALERYAITEGSYPPDSAPGVAPAGIDGYLPNRVGWSDIPHIGGQWDWDRAATPNDKIHGVYAGLSVAGPSRTATQMATIDEKIDDGDLDTGYFRRRPGGYIYILQP
jgi:prepilin-type N-terminal cleavage/methylation domain-containing protein